MTTRQTAAPLDRLPLDSGNRYIGDLLLRSEDRLELHAPYQRGSVWTSDQRIALVKSWMLGLPIPAIFLNARWGEHWHGPDMDAAGLPAYAVIDGKQRIETALAWYGDELAVPASWFPAEEVDRVNATEDGPYVCWSGLTDQGQRRTRRWGVATIETALPTVAAEAEFYLLLNGGGTGHTSEDMARAERVAAKRLEEKR